MESSQAQQEAEARAAAEAAALVAAKLEAEEAAHSDACETVKAKEEEIATNKVRKQRREAERTLGALSGPVLPLLLTSPCPQPDSRNLRPLPFCVSFRR